MGGIFGDDLPKLGLAGQSLSVGELEPLGNGIKDKHGVVSVMDDNHMGVGSIPPIKTSR